MQQPVKSIQKSPQALQGNLQPQDGPREEVKLPGLLHRNDCNFPLTVARGAVTVFMKVIYSSGSSFVPPFG